MVRVRCTPCLGNGYIENNCSRCGGSGYNTSIIPRYDNLSRTYYEQQKNPCSCSGGKTRASCHHCSGGWIEKPDYLPPSTSSDRLLSSPNTSSGHTSDLEGGYTGGSYDSDGCCSTCCSCICAILKAIFGLITLAVIIIFIIWLVHVL